MEAADLEELGAMPGVLGSMLVSVDGELLQHCLPFELAPRAAAAAPRLAVLLDALAAGKDVQRFCLRFFQHRLDVVPLAGSFLCVLSELHASSPVLRMAMNVAARRFQ